MIYFLRHPETGLIKIGMTINLPNRLIALHPRYGVLEPLGVVDGYRKEEQWTHCCFRYANVRGVLDGVEWFNPVDELMWYIHHHTALPVMFDPSVFQALAHYAIDRGINLDAAVNQILREQLHRVERTS